MTRSHPRPSPEDEPSQRTYQRRAPYNYDVDERGQRIQKEPIRRQAGVPARATAPHVNQEYYEQQTQVYYEDETVGHQAGASALPRLQPLGCLYGVWCIVGTTFFVMCAISLLWPRLNMDPWAFMALLFALLFVATATLRLSN